MSSIVKVVVLCILIAGIVVLHRFGAFEFFSIERLRGLVSEWGAWSPLICILSFPLASLLLLPNALVILVVSVLYPPGVSIVISSAGGLLAAYAGYYAGQWGGGGFVQRWLEKRKILEKYRLDFRRHEVLTVILTRFLPVPYFVQSFVSGSLKISPLKYGIGSFLELLPWILGLIFFGEGFLKQDKIYLLIGFLTLVGAYLIYTLLSKRGSSADA